MFGGDYIPSRAGESSMLGDYQDIHWIDAGGHKAGFYRGILIAQEPDGYSIYSPQRPLSGRGKRIEPHSLGYKLIYDDLEKLCYDIMCAGYS